METDKKIPDVAKAANPTYIIQCKSLDFVMKWYYLGDKNPKAKGDKA